MPGPFQVHSAAGPIKITIPTQRIVLAALALHAARPLPVARLVDAIWPDDPPESARNNLQSHVTRLRFVLVDRR
jgi:DNA-binding SARP family transcriptional activator